MKFKILTEILRSVVPHMFYLKAEDGQKLKEVWPADHIWRCEDTLYCAPCGLGFMVIFTANNNRHCYCSVHCYYSSHKISQSRLLRLNVQCESIKSWNKFYDVDEKTKKKIQGQFWECPKNICMCGKQIYHDAISNEHYNTTTILQLHHCCQSTILAMLTPEILVCVA